MEGDENSELRNGAKVSKKNREGLASGSVKIWVSPRVGPSLSVWYAFMVHGTGSGLELVCWVLTYFSAGVGAFIPRDPKI